MQLTMPEAVLGTLAHTLMNTSMALDGPDMVCKIAHACADDELLSMGRNTTLEACAEEMREGVCVCAPHVATEPQHGESPLHEHSLLSRTS